MSEPERTERVTSGQKDSGRKTETSKNRASKQTPKAEAQKTPKEIFPKQKEQLRNRWYEALREKGFSEDQLKDPHTRSTIELAIQRGFTPTEILAKDKSLKNAKQVLENAFLETEKTVQQAQTLFAKKKRGEQLSSEEKKELLALHTDRLKKASELLSKKLSEEQQLAILKAHYTGTSGVYNYTFGEIKDKYKILKNVGFSKDESRALMEAGIAANGIDPAEVNPGHYTDLNLKNVVEELRRAIANNTVTPELLRDLYHRVGVLHDNGRLTNPDEGVTLLSQLTKWSQQMDTGIERERIGFYLLDFDKKSIQDNPIAWLDSQFDEVYGTARSGEELSSIQIQHVQQKVGDASSYVAALKNFHLREQNLAEANKWKAVSELYTEVYATRIHTLVARGAMDSRKTEELLRAYMQLRAHGLFHTLGLDDSNTRLMTNRMAEILEDMRLRDGGDEKRVLPEMVARLETQVHEEQMKLAKKNIGYYSVDQRIKEEAEKLKKKHPDKTDAQIEELARPLAEERVSNEIRRGVRTAYDWLIASQRRAVIVARGSMPPDSVPRYISDPINMLNVFNFEEFLINKWQLLTAPQSEVLRHIKLAYADYFLRKERGIENPEKKYDEFYREELGKRLVRDMFNISDYFSSSWRIGNMAIQLEKVMEYRIATARELTVLRAEIANLPFSHKKKIEIEKDIVEGRDVSESYIDQNGVPRTFEEKGWTKDDVTGHINGLTEAQKQEAKNRASEFALFMRLTKQGNEEASMGTRRLIWEKIAKYRPDEIVRLFVERPSSTRQGGRDQELRALYAQLHAFSGGEVSDYHSFKTKYGYVLSYVRERGFRQAIPEQVDFANLRPEYRDMINKMKRGDGDDTDYALRVENMFRAMQQHVHTPNTQERRDMQHLLEQATSLDEEINNALAQENFREVERLKKRKREEKLAEKAIAHEKNNMHDMIHTLLVDDRFEDVYKRTISIEDGLLPELEDIPKNSGIVAWGDVATAEGGNDSLVRSASDQGDSINATNALVKFLRAETLEERIKAAQEFGTSVSNYNGQEDKAKGLAFTVGTFLKLSMPNNLLLKIFEVNELPFEMPTSEIQRILGPHAKTLNQNQLRSAVNQLREWFTHAATLESEKEKNLPEADRITLREERKKEAEKWLNFVFEMTKTRKRDIYWLRTLQILAFALLFVLAEGFQQAKNAMQESLKEV